MNIPSRVGFMKGVWIYVMLASGTGCFTALLSGIDMFDSKGLSISVIIRLVISGILLVVALVSLRKSCKYGKTEDEYKMPMS